MWDFNSNSFWDALLWGFFFFCWIAYIFIWVRCVFDMFADHTLGGFAKAIWAICFIFFGPITTLVYLIARGKSMQDRAMKQAADMQKQQERYIKDVAATSSSPAEEIKHAKDLLDSGAITQSEFDALKAKAMA